MKARVPDENELAAMALRYREDLVKDMEANLKQLREVLQETQRIADELELVLDQTRAPLGGGER